MSIIKSLKNMLTTTNGTQPPEKSGTQVIKQNKYYKTTHKHSFNFVQSFPLITETEDGWDKFFSIEKNDPKLIGFEKRSKKKFRLLHKSNEQFVVYAAYIIEIVNKDYVKRVILKDTPIEKMSIVAANDRNVILRDKENIACINLESGIAYVYHFEWQPFSSAVGDNFWLVGTRQTYEGPGELYMFGTNGELKWAISFTEPPMDTMFGPVHFTAYHLKESDDYSDIFVSSMDKLYRLTPNGELKARIAISELKEEDFRRKHEETQRALSVPPRNRDEAINRIAQQIGEQFITGFSRLTFHSPFTGFAHDPSTDMLFILEYEGRVTGWDSNGRLIWTNTFKEMGRYIAWIDNKLVLSFVTGETLWLDRNGFFVYGAKLPKEAWTIYPVPNQNKYLIICQDNRLYELDKDSGGIIPGTAGHPGMELFAIAGHNIFFDGEGNKAGYFWLSPLGHKWGIFERTKIDETSQTKNKSTIVAPEIKEVKPFKLLWEIKSPTEDGFFGKRIVDYNNQRIYVSERPKVDARKIYDTVKDEEERRKYFDAQDLVCLDFKQNRLWSKRFYNYLFSVFLSPDREHIFIGVPLKTNISYEPGFIVVLNKDGVEEGKIKAPAHGFHIEFVSNNEGIIHFTVDRGEEPKIYQLVKDNMGKWKLGQRMNKDQLQGEFGAGISQLHSSNFSLIRTDKKKYKGYFGGREHELKVSAAIYEAYEVGQNNLLVRVGNKTITYFNQDFNKLWGIKTENAVSSVVLGINTFIVVSKDDIVAYNIADGRQNWKMAAPPKSRVNKVYWSQRMITFIWQCGNEQEFYVATVNEHGIVRNSQLFKDLTFYNDTVFSQEQNTFIIQKSKSIEGYKIY
jgi:hypothetical protein